LNDYCRVCSVRSERKQCEQFGCKIDRNVHGSGDKSL